MFDLKALTQAVLTHGKVARLVIAAHEGSSPREVGAAMLVWGDKTSGGQSGTVGGGALEHQATLAARALTTGSRLDRIPLGPALGQCCGGAVTLVTEVYDATNLPKPSLNTPVIARSLDGAPMPLSVKRLLASARNQGTLPAPQLLQGWLIEPVSHPTRHLWLWGAGHVGRAIAAVMAPLPDLQITWIDIAPDRFPDQIPEGVTALPVPDPATAVALAPKDAEHLILTFSHSLDLELCHRLLSHGFSRCGLIGSATKWARFRSRLAALGHDPARIAQITCPIGDPTLGKHPQAIALGVATEVLRRSQTAEKWQLA
ncbi:MAG: xanthine dehydrogenase accessory protein XdhC [Cypionkella sp.]